MKIAAILSLIIVIMAGAAACASGVPVSSPGVVSSTTGDQAVVAGTTVPAGEAPFAIPALTIPPGGTGLPVVKPPPGRGNVYSVQIDLVPSRLVYLPGEQIDMELILTNASQGSVEPVIVSPVSPSISLVTAGYKSGPALPPNIKDSQAESGRLVKTFPAGAGEIKLAVGEKVTCNLTWDQKDENGKQVPPGWYYYEYSYEFRQESTDRSVGTGGSDRAFLIQYPQGAMQKIIELDQSRTITGLPINTLNGETKLVDVVITLERVELNEMGATFYAKMASPNNPVSGYNNPEWMGHIPLTAQYIVDGVVKEARAPNSKFTDSGIEFRWGASADDDNYLDPVPADAGELTFVIPEIGHGWEGPWEFEIPLESGLPFEASIGIANNQENFLPGDEVMYGISIRNLSSSTITIDLFPPAMRIKPVGQDVDAYSREAGNRTQDIITEYPMSWYRTRGIWNQKDNNGQQVPSGWYEIDYEYVIIEQNTGKRFTADLKTRFQIVPPDSAMQKDLEINQSATVGEITVTLESLELNAVKGTVSVFTVLPGYTPPQEHPMEEPVSRMFESLLKKSVAEYYVDGGITRHPADIRMQSNQSGVKLIWDIEPVPLDAQELTFIIKQLGEWEGLWEFKVKLNYYSDNSSRISQEQAIESAREFIKRIPEWAWIEKSNVEA